MKAAVFALTLMLAATVAWGQEQRPPETDAFRVSWQSERDPVASRIEGIVHNESVLRVTDVRVRIEGVDAASQPVGLAFAWAVGDIEPGGDTSFVFDAIPNAVNYRFAVVSYDVVSRPAARESR
jgi:hypothetical protein